MRQAATQLIRPTDRPKQKRSSELGKLDGGARDWYYLGFAASLSVGVFGKLVTTIPVLPSIASVESCFYRVLSDNLDIGLFALRTC